MPFDETSLFGGGGGSSGGILDRGLFGTLGIGELLGKPDTENIEELAEQLGAITAAEQARRLQLQEPLRRTLFGTEETPGEFGRFLSSGQLPEALRVPFTATQEAIAEQGANVREDIVSRVGARGGQLRELLTQQRLSEARQQAQLPLLEQPIRNALFQQALGTAVGQEFPIVPGFGVAGNLFGTAEGLQLAFKENIANAAGGVSGFAAG